MGCILAELLYCSVEYKQGREIEDRFLFPGSSCFPLSPCDEQNEDQGESSEQVNIISQNDQMIKILDILGKQDKDLDYSFILDEGVLKYQERLSA
jgi:hypothetical protein